MNSPVLSSLGKRLRAARKKKFPSDSPKAFAVRIGVSPATLQKMEQGDLSVSIGRYFQASLVLGFSDSFERLFEMPVSLFEAHLDPARLRQLKTQTKK